MIFQVSHYFISSWKFVFRIIYYFTEFNLDPRPDSYSLNYVLNLDFMTVISKLKTVMLFLIYYLTINEIMILNLIILALIYYINYKDFNSIRFTYIFLLLNFIFLLSAYILTSLDAEYYVRTTMDRLIFSTSKKNVALSNTCLHKKKHLLCL